jgi:hypothetical protein
LPEAYLPGYPTWIWRLSLGGACNRLLGSMADDPSRFDEGYVAASIKIPMLLIYGSLKLVE